MKNGKYIIFEGLDGCGKSSQVELTKEFLDVIQKPVLVTKEPGGKTKIGEDIRNLVLEQEMSSLARDFLFLADRAEHVEKIIKPSLDRGKIVLSDRSFISALGYSGYTPENIKLQEIAMGGVSPDLVVLLTMDDLTWEKRNADSMKDKDIIENRGDSQYWMGVQKDLVKATEKYNHLIIDAREGVWDIQKKIQEALLQII